MLFQNIQKIITQYLKFFNWLFIILKIKKNSNLKLKNKKWQDNKVLFCSLKNDEFKILCENNFLSYHVAWIPQLKFQINFK